MFELDTVLSLFVSSLLIYDAAHALRAPEHIVSAQPACAKIVLPSNTASGASAAGGFEPPSTVLICSSSNYLLGARLPSSRPGLWMTIICTSSRDRVSCTSCGPVADRTRYAVFGFMILSVLLICTFRLGASRSARRLVLEPLRLAVMAFLTISFLCGIQATILLALPLHTRLTLEPFSQSILRAWYVDEPPLCLAQTTNR
jgi:hypothetical protein